MPTHPLHKEYSQSIVLICIAPDENANLPTYFRDSLAGLKSKLCKTQNDPKGERTYMIYLAPNDTTNMEKFAPLRKVDRHTRIYIYGHSRPGENGFRSDPHVYLNQHPKNKHDKFRIEKFLITQVGDILLDNIQDSTINIDRQDYRNQYILRSKLRKLKIGLIACSTNLDKKNIKNKLINPSVAHQLFDYLANGNSKRALICDIVASDSLIFPRPYKADDCLSEFFKNYLQYYRTPKDKDLYFHKRYVRQPYKDGNWNLNPFSFFPRHQYSNNYKTTFVLSPDTTFDNLVNQRISYIKLNVPQSEERYHIQSNAEKGLILANKIIDSRPSEEFFNKALTLQHGILKCCMGDESIMQSIALLEKEWESEMRHARDVRLG